MCVPHVNKQEPAVSKSALHDVLGAWGTAEEARPRRCEACARPVPHARQQLGGTRRHRGTGCRGAEDRLRRARAEHVVCETRALRTTLLRNGLCTARLLNDASVVLSPCSIILLFIFIFIFFFFLRIQFLSQLLSTCKIRQSLASQDRRRLLCVDGKTVMTRMWCRKCREKNGRWSARRNRVQASV